jgi:osmotically-inducible protein OsmY
MNTDILQGKWKQLRGRIKENWGKLTDDDLDQVDGRSDRLAGLLQERYGYAKEKAEDAIRRLIGEAPTTAPLLLAGLLLVGLTAALGCASTDAGLETKVKAKLAADSTVKAHRIEVEARDHVVTLTGSVNAQVEKDQALTLARDTKGVQRVVDMISVRTASGEGDAPEPGRTVGEVFDDAGITMAVKGRLLDDPQVKGLGIDVDTREGVVYLTGSVHSPAEQQRAVELARGTEHVRDVVNNLTIERES